MYGDYYHDLDRAINSVDNSLHLHCVSSDMLNGIFSPFPLSPRQTAGALRDGAVLLFAYANYVNYSSILSPTRTYRAMA